MTFRPFEYLNKLVKPLKGDGTDGKLASYSPDTALTVLDAFGNHVFCKKHASNETEVSVVKSYLVPRTISGVEVALKLMLATGLCLTQGGTVVWEPNFDNSVKRIVWATNDPEKPIPEWVQKYQSGQINDPSICVLLTTTFLTTTGANTWSTPASVTTTQMEGIGGGGTGHTTGSNGDGGGGGPYGKINTVNVSGNVSYNISAGGDSATTWFSSSSNNLGAGVNASGNGPQNGGTITGTFNTSAAGGHSGGTDVSTLGGGGGAGGPNGAGNNGQKSAAPNGGSGDAGSGGAGGAGNASSSPAGNGGNGTEFDASHGSGGGGGSSSGTGNAGSGGNYGGGGGCNNGGGVGTGPGAQGLIVLTYTAALLLGFKKFWLTNLRR